MSEDSFNWSPEQMLEVTLNQPDDFLKIRIRKLLITRGMV